MRTCARLLGALCLPPHPASNQKQEEKEEELPLRERRGGEEGDCWCASSSMHWEVREGGRTSSCSASGEVEAGTPGRCCAAFFPLPVTLPEPPEREEEEAKPASPSVHFATIPLDRLHHTYYKTLPTACEKSLHTCTCTATTSRGGFGVAVVGVAGRRKEGGEGGGQGGQVCSPREA